MSASVSVTRSGGWSMVGANTGLSFSKRFAESGAPNGALTIAAGTGTGACDQVYQKTLSIAAGATLTIDLRGGTGELDVTNLALSLQKVRWLYVELDTPAASTSLQVGPLNVAQAWPGFWGGVTATYWTLCAGILDMTDPFNNWTAVGATTNTLSLKNPGAATVAGQLVIAGVHS